VASVAKKSGSALPSHILIDPVNGKPIGRRLGSRNIDLSKN
jgi:hypothetical protein